MSTKRVHIQAVTSRTLPMYRYAFVPYQINITLNITVGSYEKESPVVASSRLGTNQL